MKQRSRAKDYLFALLVRTLAAVFGAFPIEANLRTARWIGWTWYQIARRLAWIGFAARPRLRALENLRHAYPEMPDEQLESIVRRCFQHWTMLAIEVLLTPRLITVWTWAKYVKLADIAPALRVLLDKRGCIMVTPHFGNFELLGYTLAMAGLPITALMRPFDNEYLNDYLLDRRQRSGLTLLYKKGAMARAPEVLRDGGSLCFIADQDAGKKGAFVDFFGRKASAYKSIALLAMEFGVPIIVGCAQRVGSGFQYEIRADRIIRPEEWADKPDEVRWITQEFSTAMERQIREAPEQYLWMHRRWKTRPRSERVQAGAEKCAETTNVQV